MRAVARQARVLVTLIGVGLIGPAGGAAATPPEPSPPKSTVASPVLDETAILTYLDALDTVDASPALAVSSPRTPAWRYAEYQVALQEANRENGVGLSSDVITPQGDGRYQLCSGAVSDSCPVFADFATDAAGLISAFTVDGVDISDRLGDPSDPLTNGTVTFHIRSSYRTVRSDVLIVVLDVAVTNDSVIDSEIRYRDTAGHLVEITDAVIPPVLAAGSTSTLALIFPAVDPGGRLFFSVLQQVSGRESVIDLVVPTLLAGAEVDVAQGQAATTSEPDSSAIPATAVGVADSLISTLGPELGATIGVSGDGFALPDPACLDVAIEGLPPALRVTVGELVGDPSVFPLLGNADTQTIVLAYVGCIDPRTLVNFVAAATTRAADDLPCISAAWTDLVTADVVASSLAYGEGFDDLPPHVLDQMTLAAATCVPDRQWWIDDEAFVFELEGVPAEAAACMATAIVERFGVGPIIRRRVLTLPLHPVARAELDSLDLWGRCNVQFPDLRRLDAPPWTCLIGFGSGSENTQPVDCSEPHNAEVISVHDLATEFPTWPSAEVLRRTASERCFTDLEALSGDTAGYGAGWDIPNRLAWEQSSRALTCTLIRPGLTSWSGPSELAPPTEPRLVAMSELTVGQCLLGAELVGGDIGDVVEVVDCSIPHYAEVYHVSSLDHPPGTPYPGDIDSGNWALARCHPAFDEYVGRIWAESRLGFTYVSPYQAEWESNDRMILCYLWDRLGRELTGSMAGSGQ